MQRSTGNFLRVPGARNGGELEYVHLTPPVIGHLDEGFGAGQCDGMQDDASRLIAIRVIGWVAGGFWLLLFFGLVDLTTPLFLQNRPEFYDGYLISTGWGVLFTFFAGTPLCVLGAQPRWVSAALVSGAAGVTVLITGVASLQPAHVVVAAMLLVPAATVLVLTRRMSRYDGSPRWAVLVSDAATAPSRVLLLGLALLALPPAIIYAVTMIRLAIDGTVEPTYTWDLDHFPVQAASALVIPVATALLALQLPGWRAMAVLLAAGTAWFGIVSVVFPDHLASWGTVWGYAAVGWALAVSCVAIPWSGRARIRESAAQ